MRKTGITGEVIKMYENAGLDVNTIYAKSQLLLCSYRRICWSVQNDAYYLMDESCHYGEDYTAALAYLMEFAPDVQRENLNTEFRTLWNLNIGFNSSILRLNECVLFTSGETCMRNFFQKII